MIFSILYLYNSLFNHFCFGAFGTFGAFGYTSQFRLHIRALCPSADIRSRCRWIWFKKLFAPLT